MSGGSPAEAGAAAAQFGHQLVNPFEAAAWFDRDPARRERERVAVQERFPRFEWGERSRPHRHANWQGELQPFPTLDDIGVVAAHLETQEPIVAERDGSLRVEASTLAPAEVPDHPALSARFLVELVYLEPPAVPRVYALNPRIDDETLEHHPHLNRGRGREHPLRGRFATSPSADLCVFAPQDGLWTWPRQTAKDLLVWTAFWLGAHVIWQARGEKPEDWPIPAAPHELDEVLDSVRPSQPCPCGRNVPFGDCCYARATAAREAVRRAQAATPPRRTADRGRPLARAPTPATS